jgi:hypothetical protein
VQWIYEYQDEEVIPRRCICLEKQLLLNFLGPEIFSSKPLRSSLYQPTLNSESNEIEGDRTEDNLFVKGSWRVVCQHLHWVLAGKRRFSPKFTFKIVTDRNLLDVWLGNEAYKAKSKEVRDDVETNNSLSDLLSDATLLIIKLGCIWHTNKAAANVLKEALSTREFLFKPTWLIEGTEQLFGEGHKTYDDEVATYIDDKFDIVDLGSSAKTESILEALSTLKAEDTADIAMIPGEAPRPESMVVEGAKESRFQSSYDPHVEEKRKFKQYRPGRSKRSGGGGGSLPEF